MIRNLSLILLFTAHIAAQQTFVFEFNVSGLTCDGCSASATAALRQIAGVTKVEVSFEKRRARIESTRDLDRVEIRRALSKLGFEARFAGDAVLKPLSDEERARLDIKVASRGEAFDVRKHLAPGKFTIFDFWAEWCGPCHVLTPKIEHLVKENANVALRTIDLKQWDSPAGKQATKEFRLPGLPYVRVYGPDGEFIGDVLGNDIDEIRALIAKRRR